MKRIHKVAILGAGTMGARIAAHFANAGVPSFLLDIVPPDAHGPARNKIAAAGLDGAKKSKPAAFFEPSIANRQSARTTHPSEQAGYLLATTSPDRMYGAVSLHLNRIALVEILAFGMLVQ